MEAGDEPQVNLEVSTQVDVGRISNTESPVATGLSCILRHLRGIQFAVSENCSAGGLHGRQRW